MDVRVATADRVRRLLKRERVDVSTCLLVRYLRATSGAFVWTPEPDVVYLISTDTPRDIVTVLGHEALHVALNRLEGATASRAIDRLPPRTLDALDGAGRRRLWRRLAKHLRVGVVVPA